MGTIHQPQAAPSDQSLEHFFFFFFLAVNEKLGKMVSRMLR